MFNYTVFFLCYDVVFHHLLDLLIYFFFSLVILLVVLYCRYNNKNLLKYNKQQYGMYVASRVNNISTVIVIPYTTKVGCAMRITYMYIYNPYHSALLLYVKNGYYQDCQYLGNLKQPNCNWRDSHLELQVYNNYCNHQLDGDNDWILLRQGNPCCFVIIDDNLWAARKSHLKSDFIY